MYSDDGQILLLKRKEPFEFWQSVTGSLESGETPEAAARRELAEETGLTDEGALENSGESRSFTIDARWLDRYAPGVTENREHELRYCLRAVKQVRISPAEHLEFRWVSIDDAIESVWSWTNKQALEALAGELH